jgi:hypothetical protein
MRQSAPGSAPRSPGLVVAKLPVWNAGRATNRSFNFLFTVRSGTSRALSRTMAEFNSARSGIPDRCDPRISRLRGFRAGPLIRPRGENEIPARRWRGPAFLFLFDWTCAANGLAHAAALPLSPRA